MGETLQTIRPPAIPENWQDSTLPRLLRTFPRILLVDDSKFLADILATFFNLEGFSARAAYGGKEAMEAVRLEVPDIAFIDISMPDVSGLEVARHIRSTQPPAVPLLVALTGWDETSDRQAAIDAGFDHFLQKPVDPRSLRVFMGGLLDGKRGMAPAPD